MVGDADPALVHDLDEIAQVAWIDPKELTAEGIHPFHRPALQKAGLL